MFFVATAPLAGSGLINCSPKGMDTFRILGPREVAYLDRTGSGVETIAHTRENGRIVFMFCAFDGPPKIVRLHGTSQVSRWARRSSRRWRNRSPITPDGVQSFAPISCGLAILVGYSAPDHKTRTGRLRHTGAMGGVERIGRPEAVPASEERAES